jgi:integrase/recombinase XerD
MGKVVHEATALSALMEKYFEALLVRQYSKFTIQTNRMQIGTFLTWCGERGVTEPVEVTRTVLESYQRHVFQHRKTNGEPLSITCQRARVATLKMWFRWMARKHHLLHNPASEVELPRLGFRLPKAILTAAEAEAILAVPDVHDPLGLRDRAMLETFYSTGMRRMELAGLKLWDVDTEQATVIIRQGKGRKDRYLPLGDRAAAWVRKYIDEARPKLVSEPDEKYVFLSVSGGAFSLEYLSEVVRGYVDAGQTGKRGACHLFRHTMATLMLEGGADIRFIQVMLGHVNLNTTQIYTHVAVKQLQAIHRATHPAKLERAARVIEDLLRADEEADPEE